MVIIDHNQLIIDHLIINQRDQCNADINCMSIHTIVSDKVLILQCIFHTCLMQEKLFSQHTLQNYKKKYMHCYSNSYN